MPLLDVSATTTDESDDSLFTVTSAVVIDGGGAVDVTAEFQPSQPTAGVRTKAAKRATQSSRVIDAEFVDKK